jgi:hypothetical protein
VSGQGFIRRRGTHHVHLVQIAPGDRAGVIAEDLRADYYPVLRIVYEQ